MRYSSEQLQLLRDRWHQPLRSPGNGAVTEREGCRTFNDLLQLRLEKISALAAGACDQGGAAVSTESWRATLHDLWSADCEGLFAALMDELQQLGLPLTIEIEASRYEIREPWDLRGADLRGAVLCGAFLENARFEGADLSNARFEGTRCFEAHFEDALCEKASFAGAECHFAGFQGALCDHALFENADCTMVRFDQARLRHARFDGAVCFAAVFDGAFMAQALLDAMRINHLTRFGRPGEQIEAERSKPARRETSSEGEDWYIVELFPVWLRAAEVNSRIRSLLKAHGYYLEADEYQYLEMVCRRHVLHQNPVSEFFEWFFKDLMFGYGLKWKRPLISVLIIILVWGGGFALHFRLNGLHDLFTSIGYGLYYSVISFTTLGFGNAPDLAGAWPKLLLCSEALLGTVLMPLFLLAYARKILQD